MVPNFSSSAVPRNRGGGVGGVGALSALGRSKVSTVLIYTSVRSAGVQTLSIFLTEKMMSLTCGTLWSSRILAYGMGMSTPVTLVTGASR